MHRAKLFQLPGHRLDEPCQLFRVHRAGVHVGGHFDQNMRDPAGRADCRVRTHVEVRAENRPGFVLLAGLGVFGMGLGAVRLMVYGSRVACVPSMRSVWSVVHQDGQLTLFRVPYLSSYVQARPGVVAVSPVLLDTRPAICVRAARSFTRCALRSPISSSASSRVSVGQSPPPPRTRTCGQARPRDRHNVRPTGPSGRPQGRSPHPGPRARLPETLGPRGHTRGPPN